MEIFWNEQEKFWESEKEMKERLKNKFGEMMEWIDLNDEQPDFDRIHFLVDGDSIYIRGSRMQPFLYQLCGSMKSIGDCNWTHWTPLPHPPKINETSSTVTDLKE